VSRNYKAERRRATDYADRVMSGKPNKGLPTPEWTDRWAIAYHGYLHGLRDAEPHRSADPKSGEQS
jgi:hypothetical protein